LLATSLIPLVMKGIFVDLAAPVREFLDRFTIENIKFFVMPVLAGFISLRLAQGGPRWKLTLAT
jgi:hypothetical protein